MTSPRTPRQPRERGCFHTAPCSCPNRYLPEVLPETPEPPRPECECFVVPEEQWTRHYDATEPGSMVEPNPDCPVHFPASQSVPAVPVSSTGGKETGEAAETVTEALRALLCEAYNEAHASGPRDAAAPAEFAAEAEAILAAGWRPPLPAAQVEIDDEADAWYVRILDVDVHHTTESAPVNLDWTRDGQLIGVELLGPLKRLSSPLPDSETEWGVRAGSSDIPTRTDEDNARHIATFGGGLAAVRREVGPWIEVTSPLSGEALRDVEERADAAGDLP